jgi:hypothetical protein
MQIKAGDDSWDTINSTQLYRFYSQAPVAGMNHNEQRRKPIVLSDMKAARPKYS